MKKLAVVGFDKKKEIYEFLNIIEELSKKYNFEYDEYIYTTHHFELYDVLSKDSVDLSQYDAAVSFGGDGTFLYSSRVFAGADIPIFGVNKGRLGFNTFIEEHQFEKYLKLFLDGKVSYDNRSMLDVEVEGEERIYQVLNEGVLAHSGISRMIRLKVDLENCSIYDFRGDGLIVGSSTGSTAYNLSAGGPILHPSVDAFVLSPICPHTLAIRPYIIPLDHTIIVTVEESSVQPQITLDGQKIILLENGQKITFKKSKKIVKLVKTEMQFSDILKIKLGWTV